MARAIITLLLACAAAILLLGVCGSAEARRSHSKSHKRHHQHPTTSNPNKPVRLEAAAADSPGDFTCSGQSIAEHVRGSAPGVPLDVSCVAHPAFFKADCSITSFLQSFETRVECRVKGIIFTPELPIL